MEQLSALKRQYALLREEHELQKKAIRFCSARRQQSSPSSSMLACDVAVAAIFYVLFKPVNRTLSLNACAFRLVLVAIVGVAILGRCAPLLLLKNTASAAFETDQLQGLALLSIKMFERGFDVALVFFGFHCLAIGWHHWSVASSQGLANTRAASA